MSEQIENLANPRVQQLLLAEALDTAPLLVFVADDQMVVSGLQRGERGYTFIDTAGIRRKGKTNQMAEKLSVIMARRHLERADVALLVADASAGVPQQHDQHRKQLCLRRSTRRQCRRGQRHDQCRQWRHRCRLEIGHLC